MRRPVVVGVDGSAESLAAAEWAAREALLRERPLRLLYAWSRSPYLLISVSANTARRSEATRMRRAVEARIGNRFPGLRWQEALVEGPAALALARAAEGPEMLVLGRRGRRDVLALPLGAVALGGIARVERPVVVVRAGEQEKGRAVAPLPSAADGASLLVVGQRLREPSRAEAHGSVRSPVPWGGAPAAR
ncbi:universal stress protein [Streptomyces sp. NPDC041068]|uniref:universal stress protein n=1 Tax=Streptomyces sp. NPDC041068 TaxID=3155130 RepID=UPI0033F4611D